jgi:hypothetical protein
MIASLLLAFTLETASETLWEESPKGLSGIALVADGRYVAVCDRGGKAYEFSARLEEDELADFSIVREMAFEGFSDADFEGCAIDPLDRTKLWVSDEKTTSIFSFSLKTLKRIDKIALLPVYAGVRFNRSLESLSISPDGLEMWTANEDSLEQDGPSASRKNGGVVRLQRLVRKGKGGPWKLDRQVKYRTDAIGGEGFAGVERSGVADVLALGGGKLLVLEREFSRKNPLFPDFRLRIYLVQGEGKKLVWERENSFANYEGMCLGPKLSDGSKSIVLVADAGDNALRSLMVLAFKND